MKIVLKLALLLLPIVSAVSNTTSPSIVDFELPEYTPYPRYQFDSKLG